MTDKNPLITLLGVKMNKFVNIIATVGSAILSILLTIFIFLNFFSGIVAGIWLAIKGEWALIAFGFGFSIFMPWAYSIASLPSFGLAFLIGYFAEKDSKLFTVIFGVMSSLYSNAIIILWVFLIFFFFINQATKETYIPLLLWGYSTVMSPISWMASKEPPDSMGTTIGLLLAQVSYLVLAIFWLFSLPFRSALYTIIEFAILLTIFATIMVWATWSTPNYEYEDE